MTSPGGDIVVRHNEAESRFEAIVDGYLSVADYERREGALVMNHTFVPPELRGRGVAEKLVRAALAHAGREGLRVVPACSYVDAFIRRNPEFQGLVG
jgi:hypothetical protein